MSVQDPVRMKISISYVDSLSPVVRPKDEAMALGQAGE